MYCGQLITRTRELSGLDHDLIQVLSSYLLTIQQDILIYKCIEVRFANIEVLREVWAVSSGQLPSAGLQGCWTTVETKK